MLGEQRQTGAARFLYLTALLWGAVWLLAIAVTLSTSAAVRNPGFAYAALAVDFLALLSLLPRRESLATAAAAIVAASAVANAFNIDQAAGPAAQLLTTTWLNAATIVIAFVTASRGRAIKRILGAVSLSGGVLAWNAFTHHTPYDGVTHLVVLPIAYALAVGLAATEAAAAVRNADASAQQEAEQAAAEELAASVQRERIAEANAITRLLHDTVVNTLGAIRRGVAPDMVAATRERCAANLLDVDAVLTDLDTAATRDLSQLKAATLSDARLLGIELAVAAISDDERPIPAETWAVARSAVRELLTNVSKHAGVGVAGVELRQIAEAVTVVVADGGNGGAALRPGGGLARSVVAPIEAAGGRVNLVVNPGSGSSITFHLPLSSASNTQPASRSLHPFARANILQVAFATARWMVLLAILEAGLFTDWHRPVGTIAALTLIGIGAALVWRSGRTSIGVLPSALLAFVIAMVIALPTIGTGGCRMDVAESWGVDGAIGLVVLLAMLGPSRIAPWFAAAGTTTGLLLPLFFVNGTLEPCYAGITAVLPIEIGTVIVVTGFRRLLTRLWREAAVAREAVVAASQHAGAELARQAIRSTRLQSVLVPVGPLLHEIAEGDADPTDSAVMSAAGRMESALRSLLQLDPRLDKLGDMLSEMVIAAHEAGAEVRVLSGEFIDDPDPEGFSQLQRLASSVTTQLRAGDNLGLGLFHQDLVGMLTMVVRPNLPVPLASDEADGGLQLKTFQSESETLLEVSWPL